MSIFLRSLKNNNTQQKQFQNSFVIQLTIRLNNDTKNMFSFV